MQLQSFAELGAFGIRTILNSLLSEGAASKK
jgi:hypothetical protein